MANDEWRTPRDTYEYWNKQYDFVADVAARPSNALHECFFSEKTNRNGLTEPWAQLLPHGRYVFCNPPASKPLQWVRKIVLEQSSGIGCVLMLNADFTTKAAGLAAHYAQKAFITASQKKGGVYYSGRMSFYDDFGNMQPANRTGQVFFIFEPNGSPGQCDFNLIPIKTVQPGKLSIKQYEALKKGAA